ncbi:hypothetical protein GJV85_10940 [Sulfurimonas aquatica]|uniref:Uncharacterized protein n=1 Tax=Sulfurimonas aquatica TaxID=2672570 RepID=A0A975B1N7_9BACT|nr:hypothetical protein [Sulfurimonas aquatica]QSZ42601.1 hypothetical protein GJV85_10940 [Sulfurimonas aquatica]
MSSKQQVELRREYWKDRKSDFVILLNNWLKHENKALSISVDILYDAYLGTGVEAFELSEYKYGKDLQKWFDNNL